MKVARLKRRSQFITLTKRGHRQVTPAFLLQSLPNGTTEHRAGFTATKKIGNAVVRNRCKRRLRAVLDELLKNQPAPAQGYDLVLVARAQLIDYTYSNLKQDLATCLTDLGLLGAAGPAAVDKRSSGSTGS